MPRALLIAVLLVAPVLAGQTTTPVTTYGSIRTPEIQLGSGDTPTIIKVHPVVEVSGAPSEAQVSNAPPADTALLATRHFDFIVSPTTPVFSTRGSMADDSISLGEYARHYRAQKQSVTSAPDAMAQPSKSR